MLCLFLADRPISFASASSQNPLFAFAPFSSTGHAYHPHPSLPRLVAYISIIVNLFCHVQFFSVLLCSVSVFAPTLSHSQPSSMAKITEKLRGERREEENKARDGERKKKKKGKEVINKMGRKTENQLINPFSCRVCFSFFLLLYTSAITISPSLSLSLSSPRRMCHPYSSDSTAPSKLSRELKRIASSICTQSLDLPPGCLPFSSLLPLLLSSFQDGREAVTRGRGGGPFSISASLRLHVS